MVEHMTSQTFTVTGMSCEHCVRAVTAEVAKLPGAEEVTVDLASGLLTIASDDGLDAVAVAAAVDEAGYEVVP
jgi:copper chaperone CopZ